MKVNSKYCGKCAADRRLSIAKVCKFAADRRNNNNNNNNNNLYI